ncbi:hypothetical protein EDC04DRAFT_140496 [Pisolithus marmoratus]|nr:hypothetical protein EDC04DRAFT_140496 [Pisolithus marmoratus]
MSQYQLDCGCISKFAQTRHCRANKYLMTSSDVVRSSYAACQRTKKATSVKNKTYQDRPSAYHLIERTNCQTGAPPIPKMTPCPQSRSAPDPTGQSLHHERNEMTLKTIVRNVSVDVSTDMGHKVRKVENCGLSLSSEGPARFPSRSASDKASVPQGATPKVSGANRIGAMFCHLRQVPRVCFVQSLILVLRRLERILPFFNLQLLKAFDAFHVADCKSWKPFNSNDLG